MENHILKDNFSFVKEEVILTDDCETARLGCDRTMPCLEEDCNSTRITTIDLSEQGAIAKIKTANKEFFIIGIEAQNRAIAIEAFIAGADVVTFSEIEPDEISLIKEAIVQSCTIVDKPHSGNPHFLFFPRTEIEPKLKRWRNAVASEILNYWRGMPLKFSMASPNPNLDDLVNKIESGSSTSVKKELASIIGSLKKRNIGDRYDLLKYIEMVLKKWYCSDFFFSEEGTPKCCLAVLKANTCRLKQAMLTELTEFYPSWVHSGCYTLYQRLSGLVSELRALEVDAERKHQMTFEKILEGKNSYNNLKQLDLKIEKNFTSALNSLKFQYVQRIEARSLLLAGDIFNSLIHTLLNYRQRVLTTDLFIYQLQESLSDSNSLELLDLTLIEKFQLSDYRDRLMFKLGKSFLEWGFLSRDKQEILKTEVLAKAEQIAWELIIERSHNGI